MSQPHRDQPGAPVRPVLRRRGRPSRSRTHPLPHRGTPRPADHQLPRGLLRHLVDLDECRPVCHRLRPRRCPLPATDAGSDGRRPHLCRRRLPRLRPRLGPRLHRLPHHAHGAHHPLAARGRSAPGTRTTSPGGSACSPSSFLGETIAAAACFDRQAEAEGHLAALVRDRAPGACPVETIRDDLLTALRHNDPALGLHPDAPRFWQVIHDSAALRAREREISERARRANSSPPSHRRPQQCGPDPAGRDRGRTVFRGGLEQSLDDGAGLGQRGARIGCRAVAAVRGRGRTRSASREVDFYMMRLNQVTGLVVSWAWT